MAILDYLVNSWHDMSTFFWWRDIVEILFFASIVYFISLWLKKDSQKNLIGYFYGYCFTTFISNALQLTTITHFLFAFSPALLLIFVLVHQKTLQKNFIGLANIQTQKISQAHWPEQLIRTCLIALNKKKEVSCIIEHCDSLVPLMHIPFTVQSPVTSDLLKILLQSPSFDQKKMISIKSDGILIGINATWSPSEHISNHTNHKTTPWEHDVLLYTQNSDALAFKADITSHTFTVISHGKILENINTEQLIRLINSFIMTSENLVRKGDIHARTSSQTSSQHISN